MANFKTFADQIKWANGQLAICHIDAESNIELFDFDDDCHLLLLVYEGRVSIMCEGRQVNIGGHMLFDGVNRQKVEILSVSPSLRSMALVFNRNFITTLLNGHPVIPLEYLQRCQLNPSFKLSHQSLQRISHAFGEIEDILTHSQSRYMQRMLDHAVTMLMMVETDCFHYDGGSTESVRLAPRVKSLFFRFTDLLDEHVETEHSVAFYASELCVSPQYLNRIVKQASGDNVMTWISKMLTSSMAVALSDTDSTIQQLAVRFNFSDAATFTRYFKKNTGLTPSEYRNGH